MLLLLNCNWLLPMHPLVTLADVHVCMYMIMYVMHLHGHQHMHPSYHSIGQKLKTTPKPNIPSTMFDMHCLFAMLAAKVKLGATQLI